MSKILNRAIYLSGERRKVGTPTPNILLENSIGVLNAYGSAVPTDGDVGYAPGCYFFLSTGGSAGGTVYINEGTKASADFNAVVGGGGGGGGGSLETAYDNGRTINVDTGAIVFNDATSGADNVLEFNKTAAGSGNILDFDFSAAFTGNVIDMAMGSAIAGVGIHLNSSTQARTGDDIRVTDDSTGNHSIININKSGSGATIGLDYQESYNGSSASFVIKATLDNGDGLDTTILQAVRGTGIHTTPVIDINDAGTGSADIFDVDLTGIYTGDVFAFNSGAAATGNVFDLVMTNAVAMTAIRMTGAGVRTQPFVELISDCTGSASYVDIDITGAGSGKVFDIVLSTTSTGDVFSTDMDAAVGARFMFIDAGAGTRTANLIAVTNDGDGNTDVAEITDSNTGSGHVFDINVSGIGSGNVIDITYSAADTGDALKVVMADNVAGAALFVTGAGARTDSIIEVSSAETGSIDGMVYFVTTGVFTGHMLTVHSDAAATTGGLVHLDLDAGVAYKALTIDLAGA